MESCKTFKVLRVCYFYCNANLTLQPAHHWRRGEASADKALTIVSGTDTQHQKKKKKFQYILGIPLIVAGTRKSNFVFTETTPEA